MQAAAAITGWAVVPDPPLQRAFEQAGALAESLCLLNRWADAEPIWRRLLKVQPTSAKIWQAMGTTLTYLSRYPEAIAAYRQALVYDPNMLESHNNLIMLLDCHPQEVNDAQQARQVWWTQHGAHLYAQREPHRNSRDPERPLRVAYVGGDFRQHSAAAVFGPIIAGHQESTEGIHAVCYSTLPTSLYDPVTRGFQSWTEFHDISGWTDVQLCQHIRQTNVDILIDLAGYTARNRLPAFCRKPAPIQITAWGYATGVGWPAAMDYLFADPVVLPADKRSGFSERIVDLPCVLGYFGPTAGEATPLPCLTQPPTFGAFHRPGKINASVLRLWAQVLQAVPGSRLLCKGPGFTPALQAWMETEMPGCTKRLVFLEETFHGEHLEAYGQVDVVLDCFPQTGGVTTMEAAYMGCPTITLMGSHVIQRTTASVNTVLGLTDFNAVDRADYVTKAKDWVLRRSGELATIRAGLRARLSASPICAGYGPRVEAVYRELWRDWCAVGA